MTNHSNLTTSRVIEVTGDQIPSYPPVFELLQQDSIIVLRQIPEIHELGATLRRLSGAAHLADTTELLRSGHVPTVEALAAFYAAFRHLRDSRYISCLFSDLIASLGLPQPILVDTGFCRMVVPDLIGEAQARPDLFPRTPYDAVGPGEAETMLQGEFFGNPHRDLDARHYHYQLNFWFPLHDLEQERSLLLFPDAYRKDVPQYGKFASPDNPDQWGFGRALQVPLKFGDTLIFHAQQLHASPAARGKNRFTVELRVAGGCIDDNGRIYRRLFWGMRNFQARVSDMPAVARARQLVEPCSEREEPLTAHALVHHLFRHPAASLSAGYVRRADEVFDDGGPIDAHHARAILDILGQGPCGDDLWLLVARLFRHHGLPDQARAALTRVARETESYFWALEAGRLLATSGDKEEAAAAFRRAGQLAEDSGITLDRYTRGLPPPRIPVWAPQLLPKSARRVARILERRTIRRQPQAFDYREILRPWWKRLVSRLLYSRSPASGLMPLLIKLARVLRRVEK